MTKGVFNVVSALSLLIIVAAKGIHRRDAIECPIPSKPLPECPPPANDNGFVFFSHPDYCEFFYHCYQGVPKCQKCPQGLIWNSELDTCDWPWNVPCENDKRFGERNILRNSCPEIGGILPPCPFPDHKESTYHAHPGDCHWFYQCSNGVPYCQECPATLHWNAELEVCDYPYRANCGTSGTSAPSTPEDDDSTAASSVTSEEPSSSTAKPCPAGRAPACPFPDPALSVFFPHENDCHWFYHCSNGVAYCKECPADLHWNVKLETCDYPYRAGCANVPPSNSSSTAAPPPPTTDQSSSPSDPATDTEAPSSESPVPTQSTTSAPKQCPSGRAPACPFPDPALSVFFPHENDCHWFYHCSNGVAYCKECPADLHWNVKLETCDYPYRAGCANVPPSNSSSTAAPPPTTEENSSPSDPATDTTNGPIPTQNSTTSGATPVCPPGNAPQCPFPDPEYLVFFPHENDCHWFYQCANGVAHCKECPLDLHWNAEKQVCDYAENAGCASGTPSTPSSTTEQDSSSDPATDTTEVPSSEVPIPTQSSTTSSATPVCPPGNAPQCPFPDPEYLVFFPHENDCHWFYQCANGIAHCKECPQGLHWNAGKHICDYPENAGCATGTPTAPSSTTEDNSTPDPATDTEAPSSESPNPTQSTTSAPKQCPSGRAPACPFPDPALSVFFPHENDCHWFYHCSNGVAYCKECPADLHWNVNLQTCDYPYRAGCIITPSSSSAAPPPTTEENSSTSDPADTSEGPTATESSTTSAVTPTCPPGNAPQCPFPDPEHMVFFPHENDCQWFYQCANGIAHCKECPQGLHWNNKEQICDYPENAGCASGTPSTPSSTTEDSSTQDSTTAQSSSPSDPATDTEEPSSESPVPTQSTTSAPRPCPLGRTPTCPLPDPALSVFFPHENDCHWFYHCSNGLAYCKECPAGLHWNAELDTCDYPYRAGCVTTSPADPSSSPAPTASSTQENPSPTDGPTEAPSSESPSTSAPCPLGRVPNCPFPDPELSVFFPHENDCHWFYHCSNGVAYCKECPADLHWNTKLETCDYPYRAGCSVASKLHKVL